MLAQPGCEPTLMMERDPHFVATLPVLVLNAHSRCNCRCVMCDIWKREESTEISARDLERHRESLRRLRVEWVVLSGGEPLMHGDLVALCAFFRALGIRLTLLTTGLLLARRAAEVAALFDDIILSLDGPPAVHDAIRRVAGAFDLIQSGVAAVRELCPEMRITARTTVQRANYRYLRHTVLSARAAGFNGISFLAADLTSTAFNRPLVWPGDRQNEIALSEDEIRLLATEVDELIANFALDIDHGYIAESPDKLRRIVTHFQAHLGQARHQSPLCNAPWVSAVIEANGQVRPCFFHPALGSIHQSSLDEIINSPDARNFRSGLNVGEDPVCRRCVCSLYRPDSRSSPS